jgi:predicted phosphodiesterase
MADAAARFRLALDRCTQKNADAIAVLGDVSHVGDKASLEEGVRLAGATGRPVRMVPGNHDVLERADALSKAVERVGAENVRLALPEGEVLGGVRVAGMSVVQGASQSSFRSSGSLGAGGWGEEPVVLLSHYPLVSLAPKMASEGLKYPGDLEDLEEVAGRLLGRTGPTIVVHGHAHVRHADMARAMLQVSCAALIEPPFEVTLLDVERSGGRLLVRAESVPVAASGDVRLPTLSPPDGAWALGPGAWEPLESPVKLAVSSYEEVTEYRG